MHPPLFMRMQTPAFISAPIDYQWFKIVTNRHKPLVTIHFTITQQLMKRTHFSRIGFVTRVFRVSSQTVTNLSQNLVTIQSVGGEGLTLLNAQPSQIVTNRHNLNPINRHNTGKL